MAGIAALLAQLEDEQVAVRAEAAEQLCQMGAAARDATTALVKATGDDESVSQWAVGALEELGPPVDGAAAELAKLATSTNESVAYWTVTLLGRLGPAAKSAEAALVAALSTSPHQAVRERSAAALSKIGAQSAAAIDALKTASEASEPRLARLATQALAACGK